MKTYWVKAPEWANYLAMDECGRWYWYSDRPRVGRIVWLRAGGHILVARRIPIDGDWRETLEKRPHPHDM
jgi:hypothetical protein